METEKKALTISETAKRYGLPEYCVRTLVKRHEFPVIQSGNRSYIVVDIFEEYIKKGGKMYDPKLK